MMNRFFVPCRVFSRVILEVVMGVIQFVLSWMMTVTERILATTPRFVPWMGFQARMRYLVEYWAAIGLLPVFLSLSLSFIFLLFQ